VSALVVRADAASLPLPDSSVDLIVTSPPYFALRSYTDGGEHYAGQIGSEPTPGEYIDALLACTREWMRVLKPTGSLWVNLGDKYAGSGGVDRLPRGGAEDIRGRKAPRPSRILPAGIREKSQLNLPERYRIACTDQLGLIQRAKVVWSKPNGLPESVTDRVRCSHEDWVHLTRDEYVNDRRNKRPELRTGFDRQHVQHRKPTLSDGPGLTTITGEACACPEPSAPTRPSVILDPFGGTGTTALVASVLGRTGISVDLSADYCRLATWRTTDPGERARAMRVPKPEKPVEGQLGLFDGTAS
jgi:DNA modification methylase